MSADTPFAIVPATSRATPIQSPHWRPSPRLAANRPRTTATPIATIDMITRNGRSLGLSLKTTPPS
jgi:hypothetical protein